MERHFCRGNQPVLAEAAFGGNDSVFSIPHPAPPPPPPRSAPRFSTTSAAVMPAANARERLTQAPPYGPDGASIASSAAPSCFNPLASLPPTSGAAATSATLVAAATLSFLSLSPPCFFHGAIAPRHLASPSPSSARAPAPPSLAPYAGDRRGAERSRRGEACARIADSTTLRIGRLCRDKGWNTGVIEKRGRGIREIERVGGSIDGRGARTRCVFPLPFQEGCRN